MTALGQKQKSLTAAEIRFILQVKDIASIGKLAWKLGVHRDTVRRIWKGETHRKVTVARGSDARIGA